MGKAIICSENLNDCEPTLDENE